MSKTINEAMGDLIKGLGADASVLSDNSTVSDYIEDLAGAIKGETSAIIDDSEAGEDTTYSSAKIESLIPEAELPEVAAANNGQVLAVVNGEWTLCTMTASANLETGVVSFTFTPAET